jgi:hypothetical protein
MVWHGMIINGLDDEHLVGAVLPVKKNSVGPQYQETHTDFIHGNRDVRNLKGIVRPFEQGDQTRSFDPL